MFIENKYTSWYYSIINNAREQNRRKGCGTYYESHHIHPESMGGSNHKSNKVLLTAREHFIVHLLLIRMLRGSGRHKMLHAIWRMSHAGETKQYTSKSFEKFKIQYQELLSSLFRDNNPTYSGMFVTPWGTFKTSYEAEDAAPFIINRFTITKYCKHNERTLVKTKFSNVPKDWIGKSLKELGFNFIWESEPKHQIGMKRYHTPWGAFRSSNEASRKAPFIIKRETITKYCKNNNLRATRFNTKSLQDGWIGKTFSEIGFSYRDGKAENYNG